MPTILDTIIARKRVEVADQAVIVPPDRMRSEAEACAIPHRPFAAALRSRPMAVIAEIKKASPSRGVIAERFIPAEIAAEYAEGGASALSVLTDRDFFQGSVEALRNARGACALPVLRKDFIIDEYQIDESRMIGADAILLIAGILGDEELRRFLSRARRYGLECLVECHSEDEVRRAAEAGADIIGINNRDLKSFSVSLDLSVKLAPFIPSNVVRVSESGIGGVEDVRRLREAGFNAVLVGEHLMKRADRSDAIQELVKFR